ncbi:16369_t:CDS:1, partial [Dentiscutata erythropus]
MLVVENKEKSLFAYWLPSERFIDDNDEQISYMPFGYYAKKILKPTNDAMKECMKDCVAEASILERLSSLVSAYYIIVGIGSGIARIYTPSSCTDWPYVSVLLAWTFVVIFKRSICGRLIVKSPSDMLNEFVNAKKLVLNEQLIVKDLSEKDLIRKRTLVIFIGIITILFPWLSILMAYYTPP